MDKKVRISFQKLSSQYGNFAFVLYPGRRYGLKGQTVFITRPIARPQKGCLNGICKKCLAGHRNCELVYFSLVHQSVPTLMSTSFFVSRLSLLAILIILICPTPLWTWLPVCGPCPYYEIICPLLLCFFLFQGFY